MSISSVEKGTYKRQSLKETFLYVITAIVIGFIVPLAHFLPSIYWSYIIVLFLFSIMFIFSFLNDFKINITVTYVSFICFFLSVNILFFHHFRALIERPVEVEKYFSQALLIVSFAYTAILIGYLLGHYLLKSNRIADFLIKRTSLGTENLFRVKKWGYRFALWGTILVVLSFFLMNIFPMFDPNPIKAKYFAEEYHSRYERFSYLFRMGLNLIVIGVPFVLVGIFEKTSKKIKSVLYTMVAFAVILVTLKKGLILSILIIAFFVYILRRGSFKNLIKWLLVFSILIFLFLEMNAYYYNQSGFLFLKKAIVGIADFQDFVLTLSLFDGHDFYYGKSYIASLIPLPPGLSSLRNDYTISNITKHLMGLSSQGIHGGLRIFFFGEAFLNFGYAGVILNGIFLGWILSIFNSLEIQLKKINADKFYALFFIFLFYFVVFAYYQSGTVIDNIFSVFVVIGLFMVLSRRLIVK